MNPRSEERGWNPVKQGISHPVFDATPDEGVLCIAIIQSRMTDRWWLVRLSIVSS